MNKKNVFILVLVLVIIGEIVFIANWFHKKISVSEAGSQNNISSEDITLSGGNNDSSSFESDRDVLIKNAKKLNVDFYDAKLIPRQDVFRGPVSGVEEDGVETSKFYSIGKVIDGQYVGSEIILATMPFEGPSAYDAFNYFLKLGNKYYFLNLNSDYLFTTDNYDNNGNELKEKRFNENVQEINNLVLDITPPSFIKDTDDSEYKNASYINTFFNPEGLSVAFTDKKLGNVYYKKVSKQRQEGSTLYDGGGFFAKGPGGILYVYESLDPKRVGTMVNDKPQITLNDKNKVISSNYKYTDLGGCGATNYVSLPNVSENELEIAGKANFDGGNIYVLKDKNHKILKDLYDLVDQSFTETGPVHNYSYEEFLTKSPVFFWKDKFGRLIKFQSESFVPLAECGKPVIYLYPQKTEDVSVKVMPKGGFTKTIPEYGLGWNVLATPESVITDKGSGIEYPYLFWEGRGGIYETPEKGWVIERDGVESFLNEKLGELGLIEKEKKDFLEFWLPKMQDSPYYFVTFLGKHDMDNIAPLQINPKPDTVIRLLMDFKPLKEKINVKPFKIITPVRSGFTVVEWGGVLR